MSARLAAAVVVAAALGALAAWVPHAFLPGADTAYPVVFSPLESVGEAASPDGAYRARYYAGTKRASRDPAATPIWIYSVEHRSSARQICWERELPAARDAKAPSGGAVQWTRAGTVRFADPARPGVSVEVSFGVPKPAPQKKRKRSE
jgi:hypothetical protein